jgi:DNA-binding transcriptional LysR family regulator
MGPFYSLDLSETVAAIAPGVVLTFETVSRPVNLEEHLRDGIVDLAIDWLPVELDPFVNRKLFEDRMIVLARKDHPTANTRVTVDDFRNEKFITTHRRREVAQLPPVLRELHNLQMPEAVRVSELLEIPTVVASTDLLGPMLASMAPLLANRLGLQVIPIPLELPSLPIYMIWHETRRQDGAHRWLREIVATELGRFAPG